MPNAKKSHRGLFVSLGKPDQLPSLYHCATGKDRTGWASAALLTLLGVPKDKVMEDFLRSNEHIFPHYKRTIPCRPYQSVAVRVSSTRTSSATRAPMVVAETVASPVHSNRAMPEKLT